MTALTTQLEQLENAQLVRRLPEDDPAYLFKHALTQESAYESLLLKHRREIHRRVAQAYEQIYPDQLDVYAGLLAHHFAEARDDAKTVEYALRARELTARRYALPEAVRFSAQALASLARLPDTVDNRRQRVDLILKNAPISWVIVTPEQNFALLAEAEALAQTLPDERGTLGGDRRRLAWVHYWIGSQHMARNELGATGSYLEQALAEAQRVGAADLLPLASVVLGATKMWQGHFAEAEPLLTRALDQIQPTTSFERWEWTGALGYLCLTRAMRGQVVAGLAVAKRGLPVIRAANNLSYLALLQFFRALAHLVSGETQRALDIARTTITDARQSGSLIYVYFGLVLQTWAESRLGQYQAARQSLAAAKAVEQQLGPPLLFDDWRAAIEAEIALQGGALTEALKLAEDAATSARSIKGKFAEALAERVWGQTLASLHPSRWEEADAHLAESLRLFDEGDARLEAARTHVAWGKTLALCGNKDAAREHWEKAAAQFQASGLTSELEQAKQLIDSLPV